MKWIDMATAKTRYSDIRIDDDAELGAKMPDMTSIMA